MSRRRQVLVMATAAIVVVVVLWLATEPVNEPGPPGSGTTTTIRSVP